MSRNTTAPRRVLPIVGWTAAALATVALFLVSRGKWSDAIVDSGREWIVPDALSRGELLYRDVVYWFGPFTPYFQALFFRAFGSSLPTLVAAGAVASAGVLAALFLALRTVTGRRESALWTALAVPVLVFMPNAGGSLLGMGYRIWHAAAFALLAITLASSPRPRAVAIAAAGALAALSGLCRTEWGLAAVSAAVLVVARHSRGQRPVLLLGGLTAGFALVFAGAWSFFLVRAGGKALFRDAPVFLLGIPKETRASLGGLGLRAWKTGSWNLLYSACVWFGIFLLVQIVVLRADSERTRRRLLLLGAVLLAALGSAAMGAVPGPVLLTAAPLICLVAMTQGWRGGDATRARALLGFGWMGLLALHRRPFFIDDAPYVAPPLLFAFVCAGGLVYRAVRKEASPLSRRRLAAGFAAIVACLVVFAFVDRALSYRSDERVSIGGTAGMLSARPEVTRGIEQLAAAIRGESHEGDGLVVFPEGEILNYLSGRPNPIRHKLYLPGYVSRENEMEIVQELTLARPVAIVIWPRVLGEYGPGEFGVDYAVDIRAWIRRHYVERPISGGSGRPAVLALRRRE